MSALPYVKETYLKLLSDFLEERVMDKGLAQQCDDLKSLQGELNLFGGFFLSPHNTRKEEHHEKTNRLGVYRLRRAAVCARMSNS